MKEIHINHIIKTWSGKTLISLLFIIILLTLGFAFFGLYRGDLSGYIASSSFPSAILLIISILLAYHVKNGSIILVKAAWICLSIFIMLFVFMAVDFQKENALEGAGMLVGYSMGIMSFPSCFLAVFAYAGLSYILDKSELLNFFNFSAVSFYIQIIAYWLSFFIVGYLQWFKVVPLLIEKSKSRSVQVR